MPVSAMIMRIMGKAMDDKLRWVALAGTAVLVVTFITRAMTLFLGAGHDDVYIFLWSGGSLSYYPWFANANGEQEDMLSSPLAGLIAWACVAWDRETSLATFKLTGLLAATLCIPLTVLLAKYLGADAAKGTNKATVLWGLASAAIVALAPSFSYWAMGGMETAFQAILFLAIAAAIYSWGETPGTYRLLSLSVLISLSVLVRLEGFWTPLAVTAALLLLRRNSLNGFAIVMLLVIPIMVFVGVGLARTYYTGAFWPNPVYAKAGDISALIPMGVGYLESFALSSPVLLVLTATPWLATLVIFRGRFAQTKTDESPASVAVGVLCALSIGQDLFVLFSGGNWMTHYRFLVPTIPAKSVVLAYLATRHVTTLGFHVMGLGAMAYGVALLPYQQGDNPNFRSTSRPTPVELEDLTFKSLSDLQQQMIMANQPHRRDELGIRPFIESQLDPIVQSSRQSICLATYQSGYFPWHLRRFFNARQVYLVDTFGLNNRQMAIRQGAKDSLGVIDGRRIDLMVMRNDEQLIKTCGSKLPDLIYMLRVSKAQDRNLISSGYIKIWRRDGAVVYARSGLVSGSVKIDTVGRS